MDDAKPTAQQTYSTRLPAALVARLDALAAQLDAQNPVARVRRADVWRRALELGCEALERALAGQGDAKK